MKKYYPDTFNRIGALRLADEIREYWATRGHSVSVWTEPVLHGMLERGLYQVRSDICINSTPRDEKRHGVGSVARRAS